METILAQPLGPSPNGLVPVEVADITRIKPGIFCMHVALKANAILSLTYSMQRTVLRI